MISRSILSNYLGSFLGIGFSRGLRFLGIAYCVRMVGDYTWGQAVSTMALFTFLSLVMDQGLGVSPILFHLRNRAADARLWLLISCYRLCMALLMIGGLLAFHAFVRPLDPLILIYSFVLVPRALGLEWWFYRRELYQITHYVASLRALLFFVMVLVWIDTESGPATLLLIELVSEGVSSLLGYSLFRMGRDNGTRDAAPRFGLSELLRYSFPFLLISLLVSGQAYFDILILRAFFGSEVVAQYDVGIKVAFLYLLAGATIIQVIRPKLTRLYQEGDIARAGVILRTAASLFMAAGIPLLILSLYFPSDLMALIFGKSPGMSGFVFRWASVWVSLSFTSLLVADTLLSLERRRLYTWGMFAAVATNISANFTLQSAWGPQAAIFAKMAAECVLITFAYRALPTSIRHEIAGSLAFLLGALGGMLGLFAVSLATGQRMPGVAASILVAAAILWKRRVFSRETLSILRHN